MPRKPKTIHFWAGRLPHWEVEEGRYFITVHLAGAIPQPGRNRLRLLAEQLSTVKNKSSPEWLKRQRLIFAEMEKWLDQVAWNPHFKNAEIANLMVEAIEHRHLRGDWHVHEYVVMPTHLHLFCEFGAGGLKSTLEDFKRFTGHKASKLLGRSDKRFWQREWFDHWSRSDEEDDRIIAYIRNNPVKAGLVQKSDEWPFRRSRLPGGT